MNQNLLVPWCHFGHIKRILKKVYICVCKNKQTTTHAQPDLTHKLQLKPT